MELDMALNTVLALFRDMAMGLLMATDHQVMVLVKMASDPILL